MRTRSSARKIQSDLLEKNVVEEDVCSICYTGVDKEFGFAYKESILCRICYDNQLRLNSSKNKQLNDPGRWMDITSVRQLVDSFKFRPVLHILILAACVGCYLIGYTILAHFKNKDSLNIRCKDVETILTDVLILRTEFSKQYDEIWFDFAAGIDSVVNSNPARPTTFLLLHEDGAEPIASSLTERIASLAANCMNGKVLQLEAEQLGRELISDSGRLLTEYRDKIHASKVVLIDNFHRLPAALAKQLHHLCDFHQPVIGRVVYLFLMRVDYLPTEMNKTAAAEKALYELWSPQLHSYLLDPLITRITGNVIRVSR
ncbi:hypothetical protein LSTR_LSTR000594 [Laodelphax striatellus]|uniref:Uncharacterized protein n=1 Tax=Laodelphax striatellus TaxID=195883 RepID=A0A482XFZ1_LAOST|nr:hypothetical protein LSTR_LSTR000594 [Laodelphax striatellus]